VGWDGDLSPAGPDTCRYGLGPLDEYFVVGNGDQRQQRDRRHRCIEWPGPCLCYGPEFVNAYSYSYSDGNTDANGNADTYGNAYADTNTDTIGRVLGR
jgi:hypothetical protein